MRLHQPRVAHTSRDELAAHLSDEVRQRKWLAQVKYTAALVHKSQSVVLAKLAQWLATDAAPLVWHFATSAAPAKGCVAAQAAMWLPYQTLSAQPAAVSAQAPEW